LSAIVRTRRREMRHKSGIAIDGKQRDAHQTEKIPPRSEVNQNKAGQCCGFSAVLDVHSYWQISKATPLHRGWGL
jgi:hypothetical protein